MPRRQPPPGTGIGGAPAKTHDGGGAVLLRDRVASLRRFRTTLFPRRLLRPLYFPRPASPSSTYLPTAHHAPIRIRRTLSRSTPPANRPAKYFPGPPPIRPFARQIPAEMAPGLSNRTDPAANLGHDSPGFVRAVDPRSRRSFFRDPERQVGSNGSRSEPLPSSLRFSKPIARDSLTSPEFPGERRPIPGPALRHPTPVSGPGSYPDSNRRRVRDQSLRLNPWPNNKPTPSMAPSRTQGRTSRSVNPSRPPMTGNHAIRPAPDGSATRWRQAIGLEMSCGGRDLIRRLEKANLTPSPNRRSAPPAGTSSTRRLWSRRKKTSRPEPWRRRWRGHKVPRQRSFRNAPSDEGSSPLLSGDSLFQRGMRAG